MKKCIIAAVLAFFVCVGIVCAADDGAKVPPKSEDKDLGAKTVSTVTDTAKSAVKGTANIAETSVKDTVAAPKTAIQAVKDTANTALNRADAVMKTITGEDTE